jgi:hypothetical protein
MAVHNAILCARPMPATGKWMARRYDRHWPAGMQAGWQRVAAFSSNVSCG